MVSAVTALYIASGALEAIFTLLIAAKTFYQPKKIRIVLLSFSLLTLPASVVNILGHSNIVPSHWNAFAYLTSTLFMLALHFWLNLDIGKHLRIGGINYRSPFVIAGTIALGGSMLCLSTQLVILLVRNDPHPIRAAFVTGVVMAIFCDGATYIYSFSTLIHFKSQRFHEGQSKTTAIGVWFLLIQMVWYSVYGLLYIWFFSINSWDYFTVLLVFDYAARFVLCLMFTWSPPKLVIEYMSGRFFSGISHKENVNNINSFSAFAIDESKDNRISNGHYQTSGQKYTRDNHVDDSDCTREDIFYSSNVAIVTKP
ncbi:unnamed protein product [Mucor hiemalis]